MQFSRDHAVEVDLDEMLCSPVFSTIPICRTFKLLRWLENVQKSARNHVILWADISSKDEKLLIRSFLWKHGNINVEGDWKLQFIHCSELSSLKMEAVRTSETSVDNYFTWQYIPEDNSEHHTCRRENLKSHIIHTLFYGDNWWIATFRQATFGTVKNHGLTYKFYLNYYSIWRRGSSVSIVSGYGLDDRKIGVRSPAEAKDFSCNLCVQIGSGAHPASCTMGTVGPFPGGNARLGVTLTTHPHLVPRWRMSRIYTSSPPSASMAFSGTTLLLLYLTNLLNMAIVRYFEVMLLRTLEPSVKSCNFLGYVFIIFLSLKINERHLRSPFCLSVFMSPLITSEAIDTS
jgi:hypothetical protein